MKWAGFVAYTIGRAESGWLVVSQNGAEANIVAGGVTPLHIAAEQGNKQTIKHLLAAGANPNVTDEVSGHVSCKL